MSPVACIVTADDKKTLSSFSYKQNDLFLIYVLAEAFKIVFNARPVRKKAIEKDESSLLSCHPRVWTLAAIKTRF